MAVDVCMQATKSGTLCRWSAMAATRLVKIMLSRVTTRTLCGIVLLLGASQFASAQYTQDVDARSYNLGIMGGFAEVVRLGVKELALSEVMSPEEMDDILPDAKIVAQRNGVKLYREAELLVTDLYPADVALGKDVLLIYTGDTLEKYFTIKADKEKMLAAGQYEGRNRTEIARRFGQLLSYPSSVIDDLIMQQNAQ
jgi:hypothetical protein